MKRLLLVLMLGLCVVPALAQALSDVPRRHWAYDAVADLTKKSYMEGYSDRSFLGTRTLTRYEFAVVIKRIVDRLKDEIAAAAQNKSTAPVTPGTTQPTPASVSKGDL